VRPPRYGGKKKFGVYATRSPHRPNRLGLSVVKFDRLEVTSDSVILWVTGVDLVNGTPIYDIKPYLPYVDAIPNAIALEFEVAPVSWPVSWACVVEMNVNDKVLIEKILALDPRPGQDRQSSDEFAMSVAGWNITFSFQDDGFKVVKAVRE